MTGAGRCKVDASDVHFVLDLDWVQAALSWEFVCGVAVNEDSTSDAAKCMFCLFFRGLNLHISD